jgi:hypothetical protein
MIKSLLTALLCAAYLFSYAQKETKEPFTIQVVVTPLKTQPEKSVTYSNMIETPVRVSQYTLDKWAQEELTIKGQKFQFVKENWNWMAKVKTSAIKKISRNEKPINELNDNDYLLKYSYEATLTVTEVSSNTILYQIDLPESGKEQEITKKIAWIDPTYKVRLALAKNNPEKTKAIVDEMLANIDDVILRGIVGHAGSLLRDAYEEQFKTINMSLFSVKGKNYEEINEANEKINEAVGKYRAFSKKNRIPKEEVDKVIREAIPVWEKYITNNKELEEKATKGLVLNCALASVWVGEYAKATEYLGKIPEAKMPLFAGEASASKSVGATPILSFEQSADNVFYFNQLMTESKERATIAQQ